MLSSCLNNLWLAIDDFQWIVCLEVVLYGVCNFVSLISLVFKALGDLAALPILALSVFPFMSPIFH
jgi:hypothetical protein